MESGTIIDFVDQYLLHSTELGTTAVRTPKETVFRIVRIHRKLSKLKKVRPFFSGQELGRVRTKNEKKIRKTRKTGETLSPLFQANWPRKTRKIRNYFFAIYANSTQLLDPI